MELNTTGIVTLWRKEDGGQALICDTFEFDSNEETENGMFVILQSRDETLEHKDLNSLLGKKIKITIEIIE